MGSVQPNSRETELDWQFSGAPSVDARIVFEWRGEQFVGNRRAQSPDVAQALLKVKRTTSWLLAGLPNER